LCQKQTFCAVAKKRLFDHLARRARVPGRMQFPVWIDPAMIISGHRTVTDVTDCPVIGNKVLKWQDTAGRRWRRGLAGGAT